MLSAVGLSVVAPFEQTSITFLGQNSRRAIIKEHFESQLERNPFVILGLYSQLLVFFETYECAQ